MPSKKRRLEVEAIRARRPLPAIILSVDPGTNSGWSIQLPDYDAEHGSTHVYGSGVSDILERVWTLARFYDKPAYLVTETWGAGGPLGIEQWLSLGEKRGAWKREFARRFGQTYAMRRMVHVFATSWRSVMIGTNGEERDGKFVRFDSNGWKRAATRAFSKYYPDDRIEDADAAEASLMGYYACRSDTVREAMLKRELKGFEW
jgi:hypothetical protein